jgi:hypothetical protein
MEGTAYNPYRCLVLYTCTLTLPLHGCCAGQTPSSGWVYGAVANTSCQQLAAAANASDTYSEVLCCDSHECNAPGEPST